MIKINLLGRKKKFKVPKVLGIDLAIINYKLIILFYLLSFVPQWTIYPMVEEEIQGIENRVREINKKRAKLQSFLKKNRDSLELLKAFKGQVDNLTKREAEVDKVLKEKTNPKNILEKIARGIPQDLWLTEIKIDSKKKISLKGESISFKSIGDFTRVLEGSKFFVTNSVGLGKTETKEHTINGSKYRLEHFELEASIETYDPWSEQ